MYTQFTISENDIQSSVCGSENFRMNPWLFLSSTKYKSIFFKKFTTYNMPSCLWMNVTIYVNTLYLWNNDVFLGLWECSHPREREEVAGHQKPPRDRWLQRPYPPRHPQQLHPSPLQRGPLPRGRPSVWVTYRTSCLPWMVSNDCSECSWLLFTSCICPLSAPVKGNCLSSIADHNIWTKEMEFCCLFST